MSTEQLNALSLKSKLSDAVALAASTGKSVKVGDGGGLMLVVRPNGGASWLLRYSDKGSRIDFTLGQWPVMTLKMARDQATDTRRKAVSGHDPVAERKAERVKTRSADTTRSLFDVWVKKMTASERYRDNITAAFTKDVLPVIGHVPPQEVDRKQIIAILRTIEERKALVMVRRVRMWLRQMYEYGIDDEAFPEIVSNPVPVGTLRSFGRRKARNFPAITDVEDVPMLMRKLRGVTDNFIIRNALMLSAYLWQRPSELRYATWEEFDLDAARWVIPAERMKMQAEHWVPLATQVVAMLRVYQGVVGDVGLLFPGRRYGKPISEGTLTGRLNTMGYLHRHSPHGFRAMARTILDEKLKFDPRFMEKQLSHDLDDKLRGAYNRAEFWDDRVVMMQAWADWLDAQT